MTDLLSRLRGRRTDDSSTPASGHLDAARADLAPYLDDPLAPWSPATVAALDDLAVIRARRAELTADLAAATERHRRHREAVADALAAGAPTPADQDSTETDDLAAAVRVLDAEDQRVARRVLAAQAADVAAWTHGVHDDHAHTARRRDELRTALEDYTGYRWEPATGHGATAYERDMARIHAGRDALVAAIDVAVAAAGLPRGRFQAETSFRPVAARTLGAGGHPPLLDLGTSTDPDPERDRIAAEVTARVRVTWQPAAPMSFGHPG